MQNSTESGSSRLVAYGGTEGSASSSPFYRSREGGRRVVTIGDGSGATGNGS